MTLTSAAAGLVSPAGKLIAVWRRSPACDAGDGPVAAGGGGARAGGGGGGGGGGAAWRRAAASRERCVPVLAAATLRRDRTRMARCRTYRRARARAQALRPPAAVC